MTQHTTHTYVISLNDAAARRAHITNEFLQKGVDFEFFDAITPKQLHLLEDLGINTEQSLMTKGEIACLASHVLLWQKMLDLGLDYITIFEDDVVLAKNTAAFLQTIGESLGHFDVIKLETFFSNVILHKTNIQQHAGHSLYALNTTHLGAGGYIITKHGAQKVLQKMQNTPRLKPIDLELFAFNIFGQSCRLHLAQVVPAICIQTMYLDERGNIRRTADAINQALPSALESDRLDAYAKHKKDAWFRYKRRLFKYGRSILKRLPHRQYKAVEFDG